MTVGLVCSFFLNGMVFRSSRGGGQWWLLVENIPVIGLVACGSTAGLAQLGIVAVCE